MGNGSSTGDSHEVDRPTSGERLFYTLGQLYKQWRTGQSSTRPENVDIEALARTLGVWSEVEFAQEDAAGRRLTRLHFGSEVLVVDTRREFPWQLLDMWEWAAEQEYEAFEEGFG